MGRLSQDLDDTADRKARRNPLLLNLSDVFLLFDDHQVMRWLGADRNRNTAHDRLIVAFRDVVANTVRHWPTAFLDNKNPRCRVRRVPRMLSDGWAMRLSSGDPGLRQMGAPWSSDFDCFRRSTPLPSLGLGASADSFQKWALNNARHSTMALKSYLKGGGYVKHRYQDRSSTPKYATEPQFIRPEPPGPKISMAKTDE
jgi:hypothetical protein